MKTKILYHPDENLPRQMHPYIQPNVSQLRSQVKQLLEDCTPSDPLDQALNAIGYIRASTEMQVEEGDSMEDQEARVLGYVQSQGWTMLDLISDPAQSGRTARRQGFQRLKQLIKEGRVQVLVVDRIDRLARNLSTFMEFVDLLTRNHVRLISLREGIDYRKPWGKLVLYILGALAQFYSDSLSQEIRLKRATDAVNGKLAPTYRFGYCKGNCSDCTDPNGPGYCPYAGGPDRRGEAFRIPHPIEAIAVQLMFEWYVTGECSFADIARRLNYRLHLLPEGKIVSFRTKGRPGLTEPGPFDADAVRYIVSNPIYAGLVTYAGSTETGFKFRKPRTIVPSQHHEGLVSLEIFEKAQECRQHRGLRSDSEAKRARAYPLSRLLFCAGRHSPLRILSTGKNYYYADRLCEQKHGNAHQALVKSEPVENQIRTLVSQIRLPEAWIHRILAYLFYEEGESRLIQDRITLTKRLEAETYLLRSGIISATEFALRREALNQSLVDLEPETYAHSQAALDMLHNFGTFLQQLTPDQENTLYRTMFTGIYLEGQTIESIEVFPSFVELSPAFKEPGTHQPTEGWYKQP